MADAELMALWTAVRCDLDSARELLPIPPAEVTGRAADVSEYLRHNELELALDELEALGAYNVMPPGYWRALASAAGRTGLCEHQARLLGRCSEPS